MEYSGIWLVIVETEEKRDQYRNPQINLKF